MADRGEAARRAMEALAERFDPESRSSFPVLSRTLMRRDGEGSGMKLVTYGELARALTALGWRPPAGL